MSRYERLPSTNIIKLCSITHFGPTLRTHSVPLRIHFVPTSDPLFYHFGTAASHNGSIHRFIYLSILYLARLRTKTLRPVRLRTPADGLVFPGPAVARFADCDGAGDLYTAGGPFRPVCKASLHIRPHLVLNFKFTFNGNT